MAVHSDAGYLNNLEVRSRVGGYCFLSSNAKLPSNNDAILKIAQIINKVSLQQLRLSLEQSTSLYKRQYIFEPQVLKELGHKQPVNPI